jgi:hypothetical protein
MTRRAISSHRAHRAGSHYALAGRASARAIASHSSSAPFRVHEEIDETLARWWRATRMGRRQLHR